MDCNAPGKRETGVEAERPDLSIVIPLFNEEESLPVMVERLRALTESLDDTTVEILFVDDHSSDRSTALLEQICAESPSYGFIRLSANSGSHVAIFAGLEHARGRCAVFLAADLQDPPELIPEMLREWRAGAHVVWAVRDERHGISWSERLFAHTFYSLFNRVAHVSLPPAGSDFALLDRVVLDALARSASASPFLMGEIAQIGFKQTRVGYVKEERKFGTTKWNLRKKLRLFADAFVACSYFPLRAMSYVGIGFSVLGFLYALFIIAVRVGTGSPVEGWSSLMVIVLVLGGVQMTMLGVLGEYLYRTLEESRRRPPYFVESGANAGRRAAGGEVRETPAVLEMASMEEARVGVAPPAEGIERSVGVAGARRDASEASRGGHG